MNVNERDINSLFERTGKIVRSSGKSGVRDLELMSFIIFNAKWIVLLLALKINQHLYDRRLYLSRARVPLAPESMHIIL